VQFDDDTTCDNTVEDCGIQSVDCMLDKHLTRAEKEPEEEEEVAQHEATLLDALEGLETVTKYMCHFDTENNILLKCNEAENELYKLRAEEEEENYSY
jgi:hypothetical protein